MTPEIIMSRKNRHVDNILEMCGPNLTRTGDEQIGYIKIDNITSYPYHRSIRYDTIFNGHEEEKTAVRIEYYYVDSEGITRFHNENGPAHIIYNMLNYRLVLEYKVHGEADISRRMNYQEYKWDVNSDLKQFTASHLSSKERYPDECHYDFRYDTKERRYVSRFYYSRRPHAKGPSKFISFIGDEGFKEREYLYMTALEDGYCLHRSNGPAYEYNRAGETFRRALGFFINGVDHTYKFGYQNWHSDTDEELKDFMWMMATGEDRPVEDYVPPKRKIADELPTYS